MYGDIVHPVLVIIAIICAVGALVDPITAHYVYRPAIRYTRRAGRYLRTCVPYRGQYAAPRHLRAARVKRERYRGRHIDRSRLGVPHGPRLVAST